MKKKKLDNSGQQPLIKFFEGQNQSFSKEPLKRDDENEFMYRSIIQNNPQPILIFDNETLQILEVNRAAIVKYGYTEAEFLTLTIKDIKHPEEVPKLFQQIKNITQTFDSNGVWKHRKKNGDVFFVELAANTIIFNNRKARYVSVNDITARLSTESQLRREAVRSLWLLELYNNASALSDNDLYYRVLDIIVKITNSRIGFYHELSDNQDEVVFSTSNLDGLIDFTILRDNPCPLKETGTWTNCAGTMQPVIDNNYKDGSGQLGLKSGKILIDRLLSVPVIWKNKVRFILAVGNKTSDYDESDVDQVKIIGNELFKILDKRKVENFLRKSEEKYRNIFENVEDIYYESTLDGILLEISPSIETVTKGFYTRNELIGKPIIDFYSNPDQRKSFYSQLFSLGRVHDYEIDLVSSRGIKVTMAVSSSIKYNNHGRAEKVVGIIRDISERKKAEADLIKSEKRFAQVVECSEIWVWEIDTKGRYTYVSDKVGAILGYTKAEIVGKKYFHDFFAPEVKAEQTKAMFESFSRKERFADFINPNIHKDGHLVMLETSGIPMLDDQGNLIGYRGADKDVTSRVAIEKALRESEYLFRNSQRAASIGSFKFDFEANIWESSEVFDQILGVDKTYPNNAIGILTIIHPEDREMIKHYWEHDVIKKRNPFNKEYRIVRHTDGAVRWVLGLGEVVHDPGNNIDWMIGTLQDITPLKEALEELSAVNKDLEARVEMRTKEILEMSNLHRAILVAVPDLLLRLDNNGVFLSSFTNNPSSIYATSDAFLGKRIEDVLPPNVAILARNALDQAFNSHETVSFEYQLDLQGETKYYENRILAISDHEGISIIREITLRKIAEEFVRIQRDLAIDLSIITDQDEALRLSLEAILKIQKIDSGGIYLINSKGSEFNLMVHKGLSPAIVARLSTIGLGSKIARVVLEGKPVYGAFEKIVPPNLLRPISTDFLCIGLIPIKYEGKVIGFFNVGSKSSTEFNDTIKVSLDSLSIQIGGAISRINTGKKLLSSQQNFKILFDTIEDFIFISDLEGKLIKTNSVVEKRLGYTRKELGQLYFFEIHPPEFHEKVQLILDAILESHEYFGEIPLYGKDGILIPVETHKILGKWDNKDAIFAISRDITERQKAQRELQLRESYLTAVIHNHPGMFWLKDLNGKFIITNLLAEQVININFKIPGSTIIGMTDFDFYPKDDAIRYYNEDQYVIRTLKPKVIEEQKYLNNRQFWVETYKFPVFDKNLEVIGISGYAVDITERKKSEAALKMQSAAFESFSLAIIITDVNANIQWANTAFSHLTGYSRKEILEEKKPEILKSGNQKNGFYKNLWDTILNGNVWSGELINRRKDGSLYWEEMTITPVFDYNGKISSFIAIKIDITGRMEMEKALRESEARWNFALEGSGHGVWDWNIQTNEVFFSKQWKLMLGYSVAEIGNSLEDWETRVHPDDKEKCYADLNRHLNCETEIYENEHRMLCKDGSFKWILDRGKIIEWAPDGKPQRIIGTHTDISTAKQLEDSLKAAIAKEKELNEIKSRFVSMASHEFKTQLASIMLSCELLISYGNKMDELKSRSKLNNIKDQVVHLSSVVQEVMQLSKIQEGKLSIDLKEVDFLALTQDTLLNLNLMLPLSNAVQFSSQFTTLIMNLDNRMMVQVLNNLISNAIKYSGEKPAIQLKLYEHNHEILLSVEDNGIGIAEKDQKYLFQPFFRAGNVDGIQGNGLGLNIVKESLRRHGGDISFVSSLGKGSKFIVHLPEELVISSFKSQI